MKINKERLQHIISRLGGHKIIVLGDVMLDEYLWGNVSRISPEAPVPVVQIEKQESKLGGAANVALNLRVLGDYPILVGVCGRDAASGKLKKLLGKNQIADGILVTDNRRPTTTKTRIIAHSQQVVRADWERAEEISQRVADKIIGKLKKLTNSAKALIISDYGKGVITKNLLDEVIDLARKRNLFIAVDPKDTHFFNYKKVSVITPNHIEAGFVAGRRIASQRVLEEVGCDLLHRLQAESLLITRGEQGMSLFTENEKPYHIPTAAQHVYDVTGAGDTVISSFVSSVCAGANLKEAAWISNHAAGVVIREIGTAQVSKRELLEEIKSNSKF